MMVVGNIFMGERYAEPSGAARITNETTGEFAEFEFRQRGAWSTRPEDLQFVSGTIKSKTG